MSQRSLDSLARRLDSDPALAAAMASAVSVADAQHLATEHGFSVSADDLAAVLPSEELTEAEPDAVSGGCDGVVHISSIGWQN